MSKMKSFINDPKNFENSLQTIRSAGRPEKFNKDFLIEAGFGESKAILYNNLFIALDLVEEDGKPGKDYGRLINTEEESKSVISEKVWEKYTDIFAEERHAYALPVEKLTDVFKKVYGDEHSEAFLNLMASTFKALVDYAGLKSSKKAPAKELVAAEEYANGVHEQDGALEQVPMEEEKAEMTGADSSVRIHEEAPDSTEETADESNSQHSVDFLMDLIQETPSSKYNKKEDTVNTNIIENDEKQLTNGKEESVEFLKKALVKRVDLLKKLDRNEDAVEALEQLVNYFENSDHADKDHILSKSLIQKAELLEKLGKDEETLAAYEQYIQRYYK